MRPANLWHLYRVRLRARLLQECFAVAGIAAGVALLFSSQVASSSLLGSAAQLSRGIVGNASLQLLARGPQGMPSAMLAKVRRLDGVRAAAPLLEASANVIGPRGSRSVELVGADESLRELGGTLVRRTALQPFGGIGAIVLTASVSSATGVSGFGQEATFQLDGRNVRAPLYAVLRRAQIGALAASPIAVAPLSFAQQMAGLDGRLSRILVQPDRNSERQVRAGLQRLASGRLDVQDTGYDERLFSKAAAASNQSTVLFAVISSLIGFLFAFNAMLLTVSQRRGLIAYLRRDGYGPATVIVVLLLDALALGLVACVLGLALGDALSRYLFVASPGYLASAFALGSQRVVSASSIAVSTGGGMVAAVVAVLSPLRDIFSRNPRVAVASAPRATARGALGLAFVALVLLAGAFAILLGASQAAIVGMILLVAALLLVLPAVLDATLALVRRIAPTLTSAVPHVAAMELGAARGRAVAIAATGAIAVFGGVAIQGAHRDLLHGLEDAAHDMNAFTDVWVSPAGSYNLLNVAQFAPTQQRELARLPGVRAVRTYRGGLLDWRERRVWVIAPPRGAEPLVPSSQIVAGNATVADERVRQGGWAILSRALASEHGLRVGEPFTLPAPQPTRMRVAALSTNVGWPPGAIVLNATDYARAWGSDNAAAYNVLLAPGVNPTQGVREVQGALGQSSGLAVQSAKQHADRQRLLSREGLSRLTQVGALIAIGAVLAIAAAMGTMVWQRRPRLAKLKLEGFSRGELWRTVLLESVLLLLAGCLTGAIFGLLGEQLLDRALAEVINFPVVYSVAAQAALTSVALVLIAAAAAISLPGYLATGVSPAVALQD